MTEINSKYKHLSKLKDLILQCISCGDCREATDYTMDPPKWGVCVAKEHSTGFEPFFGRGKMQIIRSLWQGKLELSKDMAEVIYQCPTCNACSETCAYDLDNVAFYEALRAELVDAGCGLEAHVPMNKAMVELLNPYQRDNKLKEDWLKTLDFKVKDATTEKADVLYFVGCTAALTPDIQAVAINTAKVLKKLGVDFSVFGEHEVCCGSVAMRTGDRKAFNIVETKNYELIKNAGVKTIITSCAGCYRTLKGVYEEPRELLIKMANLTEMKTIKQNAKCCGAGGGVKKGFPELSLEIAKSRVEEAEETGADYIVSICPFCYRNLSDGIIAVNSNMKMVDLLELIDQALN